MIFDVLPTLGPDSTYPYAFRPFEASFSLPVGYIGPPVDLGLEEEPPASIGWLELDSESGDAPATSEPPAVQVQWPTVPHVRGYHLDVVVTSSSGNRSDETSVLGDSDLAACTPQLVTGGGAHAMVAHGPELVARFADGSVRRFDGEEELTAFLEANPESSSSMEIAPLVRPHQLKLLGLEPTK